MASVLSYKLGTLHQAAASEFWCSALPIKISVVFAHSFQGEGVEAMVFQAGTMNLRAFLAWL